MLSNNRTIDQEINNTFNTFLEILFIQLSYKVIL